MNQISSFLCPISQDVMKYPVMASDGHSYDREHIVEWFKTSNKSPITNLVLPNKTLIPNHALRNAIQEYNNIPHPTNNNILSRDDILINNYSDGTNVIHNKKYYSNVCLNNLCRFTIHPFFKKAISFCKIIIMKTLYAIFFVLCRIWMLFAIAMFSVIIFKYNLLGYVFLLCFLYRMWG